MTLISWVFNFPFSLRNKKEITKSILQKCLARFWCTYRNWLMKTWESLMVNPATSAITRNIKLRSIVEHWDIMHFRRVFEWNILKPEFRIKNDLFPFEQVGIYCNETFDVCKYRDEEIRCCEHFFPVYSEHGLCFSFNPRYTDEATKEWVLFNFQLHLTFIPSLIVFTFWFSLMLEISTRNTMNCLKLIKNGRYFLHRNVRLRYLCIPIWRILVGIFGHTLFGSQILPLNYSSRWNRRTPLKMLSN